METFLAVLMALGIYLVGPAILGFAIGGIFVWLDIRAKRKRVEQAKVAAEAEVEELAKTQTKAEAKEAAR